LNGIECEKNRTDCPQKHRLRLTGSATAECTGNNVFSLVESTPLGWIQPMLPSSIVLLNTGMQDSHL